MKQSPPLNQFYPVWVWLVSILIGTLGLIVTLKFYDIESIALSFLFSFSYSLPALLVYYIAFRILAGIPVSVVLIKLLLAAVAISGSCITLNNMLDPPKNFWEISLYLYYAAAILISSFIFRIRKTEKAPPQARSL